MNSRLERELDEFLIGLGFELVMLERGGGRSRPLLRLRVDRAGETRIRSGVTVDDCALVSREVQEYLAARPDAPEGFVLEVSSPGVERPLVRDSDYERFAGETVRLRGFGPLWNGERQIDGELIGLASSNGQPVVAIEIQGERVEISLAAVAKAMLVYRAETDL
jgi:ribosome maturation factor RimP